MSISFPFLQVAFDKLRSPELLYLFRRWEIELDGVESLQRLSAVIQAFYDEAEVKQFTNDHVKLWLHPVKQLLYDVEDMLDDFLTDLLHLKLESESQTTNPHQTRQGIERFGSSSGVDINKRLKKLKLESEYQTQQSGGTESAVYNIAEELPGIIRLGSKVRDINEKLKSVVQEGVALGLMNLSMGSGSSRTKVFSERPPTSSLVNSSIVFGRDEDKWEIVKWLLSDKTPGPSKYGNNFSVLPIVGMGGAGKTTLAQLVYNDETVERFFQLKAWVCVSEDFDVVRLTKEILESATGSSPPYYSLDLLQVELKKVLSNKRFLLVMDDMWNEDHEIWDALRIPFAFGKPGSKILVTTRNKGVSSIVRTVLNDYDLKGLSDEACFELVRRHTFMDGDSCDVDKKLKLFGHEIVKKCEGLPLAVKTLAGLLQDKRENNEWKDILENEIWDLQETKILPSLMLSYYHLPPLLKRCFTYLALFPKDYVFDKIELVILWMAEGIVQPKPNGKKRVEDIGAGYFDELFMRSFFDLSDRRPSNHLASPYARSNRSYTSEELLYESPNKLQVRSFFESSSNMGSGYVMHDLIHDLAEFVSGGIYCRREYDKASKSLTTTTRHLSYLTNNFNFEATEFEAMKSLRTLLDLEYYEKFGSSMQFQFQFQFLRVLRFRMYHNYELPDSIGNLKHLRLLDLSFSYNIVRLPDSITSLYNLQTLILTGCEKLIEFPEDMGNLVNLRHLFLPVWSIEDNSYKMPVGVGYLTSLQTLSTFFVGSKNVSELRELSQQLRGCLDISNLENVGNNGSKAMVANLKNKPHLLGLQLRWSHYKNNDSFPDLERDEKVEEDVLDQLQPHTNLEALWVLNYGGTRFSSWIEHPSFSHLETVSLICCRKCWFLPNLRQLPFLKHLVIHDCSTIKIVGCELNRDGSSSTYKKFQSLETLSFRGMVEWEEWPEEDEEGGGQFPCLRELILKYCPKLRMFSHWFPVLVELKIGYCDNLTELPRLLPSLRWLDIRRCPKLVVLPNLPFIERLYLSKCVHLTALSESDSPSSSSSSAAAALAPAPCVHNSFPCLRELKIEHCPNLRELKHIFPSLELLQTRDCKELCFLPKLPSVKQLSVERSKVEIKSCPSLVSFPETGFPVVVRQLEIRYCENLGSLPKGLNTLTSLQELEITSCPALVSFPETGLPAALRKLKIQDCKNLESLPMGLLHNLTSLQSLALCGYPNLSSLPDGLHKLMSLQRLEIKECPALEFFPVMGLPNMLRELLILKCGKLNSLPKGLQLTSLQILRIEQCPVLEYFLDMGLPIALQELWILKCGKLNCLPKGLQLTSLQILMIEECPALESFPDMGLPTALRKLSILKCGKLKFLPKGLHNLTNLEQLEIEECSFLMECKNLEFLYSSGLHNLSTLPSLIIGGCPALVSIPKGMLPTNLRYFYIKDCPILESIYDGLFNLTSLEYLDIQNCPMLTQQCQEREGEEWSKIAQIPVVIIDGERQ
ncbi:putative disease resistance RPP13-like protein 1 [Macadamia integrifolia]|uniref:putative disease resistance RPP13-like protein 1 n=1 Tax=Macadamia integrifolia TaxID=60698 RepID=UPI001C4F3461|nr:putative disease resistance RPP13-like protein 1 [Macadamia integrifolia]XP_042485514.1 putative disease resistance RPP13-like protein 1 [Macadamia integrifolia]XP_042485515.1 putative disease resistance RPP13-like protein 1 [Macadamia integrifolia]XP_042485516.1 putative disease resistance RPP13-like protein 1 [Macadamia integrifolia]XP_042485517.1 putative disease resistance RPP13-like protein 1 [Macadamia integrifolia]XP_042485518.1 putative disease resistance RPP13-like protein 1 [Macad